MRFFADGPSLPDDLLTARDEGRTLFFCGAGVSLAKAHLPNFFGLARAVLATLRALPESPASKLVAEAEKATKISGAGGLIAADRVFGLLEREFSISDIQQAVGRALKPKPDVDLRAHRILLKLSSDQAGKTRLVTTNFDLLFEAAAPKARVWTPLHLPQFRDGEVFDGIVHLHGMFDGEYKKPVGGNLILSSAEFGRAYLAEGWATEFIRKVIKNYRIVFVGYTADDPPVQYLLEALNRSDSAPVGLYAFQSGNHEEATALWAHKGVTAIAYSEKDRHAALWHTLEAWSQRAANPDKWRQNLIRRAGKGPWNLEPHERGQVVHLAMTNDGARAIAQIEPTLPATWLCSFDPSIRYGRPSKFDLLKEESSTFDPFKRYGLDSDPKPVRDEKVLRSSIEIPVGVLDALKTTGADSPVAAGTFCGHQLSHSSYLPTRLLSLSSWFNRVCGEPTAIWWAAGQQGLHPRIIDAISFALDQSNQDLVAEIRSGWRYLLESWKSPPENDHSILFNLKAAIAKEGWTPLHTRRFAELSRPYLKAARPYSRWHLDGKLLRKISRSAVVMLDVHYPQKYETLEVPDEQLARVLPLLRKNLEVAVDLEQEVSPGISLNIAPIEPDISLPGDSSDRGFGINVGFFEFVDLFRRYLACDPDGARRELDCWRHDDRVFDLLRVWATRLPNFMDDETAAKVLASLSPHSFWEPRLQRDLLLSLRNRWNTISENSRLELERRLLTGPISRNRRLRAWSILQSVTWLHNEGCSFRTKTDKKLERLRIIVPEWKPAAAERASASLEGRGGWVTVQKPIDGSDDVPLANLLSWAKQRTQKPWGELREIDPIAGLAERRPVRVLAALRQGAAKGEDLASVWVAFLLSTARRSDKPCVAVLIARRLASFPTPALASILDAACYWADSSHKILYTRDRAAIEIISDRLLEVLASVSSEQALRIGKRDWVTEALASAPGHLSEAVLGDPTFLALDRGASLPELLTREGSKLLTLAGDYGRFALALFARHLGRLHYYAPDWSEVFITSALGNDEEAQDAVLAGFFLSPYVYSDRLYQILKPILLALAAREIRSQSYSSEGLGAFCFRGWLANKHDGEGWLSSEEFRRAVVLSSETFKTHVLWQVGRQDFLTKVAFFREVWPLHLSVKTAAVITKLCVVLFDESDHFSELADIILPFVARIDNQNIVLPLFGQKVESIIAKYPEVVLEIVARTLSEDVKNWPYGVPQTLDKIVQAAAPLSEDPRMLKLRGIWERR